MTEYRFNAPPGWPVAEDWRPPEGWTPPSDWPAAPANWQWWLPVEQDRVAAVPAQAPQPVDPNTLWQSVGRPLKGFGGGKYRLTPHYLFFEKGTLSTNAQQVPIAAVLDVDVFQSMAQKARAVGTVRVHIQRPMGVEIVSIEDISDFRDAQRIINETAGRARLALQRQQNTMHYSHAAPAPHAQPPQAAPAPTAPDPIEQLKKLGELRDAGVLTHDEFESKKADILGRM